MSDSSTKILRQPDASGVADLWRQYFDLTKPRVVLLIVFTAVVGMLLSVPGLPDPVAMLLATLGIGLAAAAGAAGNQIIEMRTDALMARTQGRPLPTGRVGPMQAIVFALLLAVLSMTILAFGVNLLTAVLTFASMIGYAIVYTVYLKPATPQNIVVGGAAGAAPPILGWAAMTGSVSADAWLLFLIIFFWTPPHFWALALYRRKEYKDAGVPMLPVTHGEGYTRLHIVLYAVLLVNVTMLPLVTGMFGGIYLVASVVLNGRFIYLVYRLYRDYSDRLAHRTFVFSINYLALLFASMLLDHYLWPWLIARL